MFIPRISWVIEMIEEYNKKYLIMAPSNANMRIVKKVWGAEHWIVNKEYCGKKLVLNKQHRCSLHGHKKKDETFYIIKGAVLMELSDDKGKIFKVWAMHPGDIQHITPNLYHRFTGIEDSEIIEFSTTHDEADSYRLIDANRVSDAEFKTILESHR